MCPTVNDAMVLRYLLFICGMAFVGCGGPAQLGVDEESFKAVDAFYTAVTARQPNLVTDCEGNFSRLHDAGKLSDAAWSELQAIVSKTRNDQWEPAAKQLYEFMRGQRREGIMKAPPPRRPSAKK